MPDYGESMHLLFSEAKKFGQLKECAEGVQRAILDSNELSLRPLGRTLYRYLDEEGKQWANITKDTTRRLIEANGGEHFAPIYQEAIVAMQRKTAELSDNIVDHLAIISQKSELYSVKMACTFAKEGIVKLAGPQRG